MNWLRPYVRSKKRFYKKFIDKNVDTDKDRVPNYRDCQPLNPCRQHMSRTMKRRIKRLPIYASSTSLREEQVMIGQRIIKSKKLKDEEEPDLKKLVKYMHSRELPHISSKEARKTAPKAVTLFYSATKKYPGVVSEIERTKPKKVIVTSKPPPDEGSLYGWVAPTGEMYVSPRKPQYSKIHKKKFAEEIYHESKHVEQVKGMEPQEILAQCELPYEDRPMEIEAYNYQWDKIKEYHKGRQPSGKSISKILDLEE